MIGIDQSLNSTGIVYSKDGKVLDFKLIKHNSSTSVELRIKNIGSQVYEFCKKNKCLDVRIESLPFSANSRSVRPLAGLFYYLSILLLEFKVKAIEPTMLKKFATKNGKAQKQDIIDALPADVLKMFNKYNCNKKGGLDDLADAYFLSIIE